MRNIKEVYLGYSVGVPPTSPPRQDWPIVAVYPVCPRNHFHAHKAWNDATAAAQQLAQNIDRVQATINPKVLMDLTGLAKNGYDFICYTKPYFSHHTVYNPNFHPIWVKVEIFAPRKGYIPGADPNTTVSDFLNQFYRSCVVAEVVDNNLSTTGMKWNNVDTSVTAAPSASTIALFPQDRSILMRRAYVRLSGRKKILLPAGATYKFRIFHRAMGPFRASEIGPNTNFPYPYSDRIVKMSVISTVGMVPYATDSTAGRIKQDWCTFGVWQKYMSTVKHVVLNKPVFLNDMRTEQANLAVVGDSVGPQVTVSQQTMGNVPA